MGPTILEQQTPIPQIKDEASRRAKTRHFPILDLGEGRSTFSILGTSPPVSECGYRNPRNFCSIMESGIRETFACEIRSLVKVHQLQLKNKSD